MVAEETRIFFILSIVQISRFFMVVGLAYGFMNSDSQLVEAKDEISTRRSVSSPTITVFYLVDLCTTTGTKFMLNTVRNTDLLIFFFVEIF